jgi:hypothetical protein
LCGFLSQNPTGCVSGIRSYLNILVVERIVGKGLIGKCCCEKLQKYIKQSRIANCMATKTIDDKILPMLKAPREGKLDDGRVVKMAFFQPGGVSPEYGILNIIIEPSEQVKEGADMSLRRATGK